jgi:hypothetical protein
MIKAIRHKFNGPTTLISAYDQNKTNLGSLIRQYSGATTEDFYAGPARIGIARPMEAPTAIPGIYPHIVRKTDTIDWIFLADNATAAATRRVVMYEFNKETSTYSWMGFITLTFPTATNHTIRALRMVNDYYTTGTVSVAGTAVTGTGTLFQTDRMCVGSRIGFGSTNPENITTWYEITAIGSNTSITIDSTAGTIGGGTPYVIQDLIALVTTTNATTTNGGLYIAKGLRIENFNSVGTTIPAAVSTDNIRAVYWLSETTTTAITTAAGCGLQNRVAWNNQRCHIMILGVRLFTFNFRAPLSLTAGKDLSAFLLATGVQAVTGTPSQANNGRIGTLQHGIAAGIESFYFTTTTRVIRVPVANITNGSTTFIADQMVETPPGTSTSYSASGALSSVEIDTALDRLIIMSSGSGGARSYITDYKLDASPFLHIFLCDDKQLDASFSEGAPHPAILQAIFSVWSENGILHLARLGVTNITNQMYSLPIGSHQSYAFGANQQLLITPRIDLSDANKLYNFNPNNIQRLGTDTFSLPLEPFKMYYRTSGISDNTGGWILMDQSGDLTGVMATQIQFAFAFKVIGTLCIPARIMGYNLTYEDNNTDSHYEPSVANSSIPNRIFAYRQATLWGGTIPNLRIRLYNASSGALLIDDNTLSPTLGTFQYSTNNGSTWLAWSNSSDIVGNYIRYTATSLPAGVRVRALITQA